MYFVSRESLQNLSNYCLNIYIEGDGTTNPDDLFVRMIFKNREAFKLYMALYVLNHKFICQNQRSTPYLMVLKCSGVLFQWRVYAIKLADSDLYEIRRATLTHRCTVDERESFHKRPTTAIIRDMMRWRYAGEGGGPRPGELREMMHSYHGV